MSDEVMQTKQTDYKNIEISSWEELDAKIKLLRGIYAYGYEQPQKSSL